MEANDKNAASRNMGGKLKNLYNSYMRTDEPTQKQMNNDDTLELHHEANDPQSGADEITSDTQEYIDTLEKEREEYKNQALRAAAELQNVLRRTDKEKKEIQEYANRYLLEKMLPILDELAHALDAAKKSTNYESLLSGVEMIYSKTQKIFENAGVQPIVAGSGEPFNVEYHEAIHHIPHEAPEGHIAHEVQRGYLLRDKVLRHSKVVTSAGKSE